jgi:hypothetical protein
MYTITLLGHELKKRRLTYSLTLVAIFALFLYSFSLLNKLENPAGALLLPIFALAFPLVLWTLWNHWQSLREDWQESTTHMLFSFPVQGWQVLLAKGGAQAIAFIVFTLVSAAMGGALMVKASGSIPLEITREELWQLIFSDGKKLYLQYLLVTLSLLGFSQLAFVLGQLAPRWHGLFSAGGFVLILYLWGKSIAWLEPFFMRLPQVTLSFGRGSFNPWYAVFMFIFAFLGAVLGAWLLEYKVDF